MAEDLALSAQDKEGKYRELLPQVYSLIEVELDIVANMANITAALKECFGYFWVGFYVAASDTELVLGPFQGPVACTRIRKGKGVCGTVFQSGETLVVPDVDSFPGHIACSSRSRSEIVVPVTKAGKVVAVLDVDSDRLSEFDDTDRKYLEELCRKLSEKF